MSNFEFNTVTEMFKTGEEDNGNIKVKIVVSSDKPDREKDQLILKNCFDEETVNNYLSTGGVIDFNHLSVRGKTAIEKATAHIGSAQKFYFDNNKPVIEGILFKDNPFVKDAIAPALNAGGSKVWKSSIGGSIKKAEDSFDETARMKVRKISKIGWQHTAICPAPSAIQPETSVEMIKSIDVDTYIRNSDNTVIFDGFNPLLKALTVGYATDMADVSGGQALTPQSLEGYSQKIINAIEWLADNDYVKFVDLVNWFCQNGFTKEESAKASLFIVKNKDLIMKKIIGGNNA